MSTPLGGSWDCVADFPCCHGSVTCPVAPTHTWRMEDHPHGLPRGETGPEDTGTLEPRFRGCWPQWGCEEGRQGDHLHLVPSALMEEAQVTWGHLLGCI